MTPNQSPQPGELTDGKSATWENEQIVSHANIAIEYCDTYLAKGYNEFNAFKQSLVSIKKLAEAKAYHSSEKRYTAAWTEGQIKIAYEENISKSGKGLEWLIQALKKSYPQPELAYTITQIQSALSSSTDGNGDFDRYLFLKLLNGNV